MGKSKTGNRYLEVRVNFYLNKGTCFKIAVQIKKRLLISDSTTRLKNEYTWLITVYSRIQSALDFADSLNEKKFSSRF